MDNKHTHETSKERRPYTQPEIKKLGKLNLLIKGNGSCGPQDSFPMYAPGTLKNNTPNC